MQFTSSLTKDHLENTTLTRAKLMLPYFRIKTLKRHTLLDIYTYLSSRYMGVLPPPLPSPPLPSPPLPSHTHTHTHTHPRTKSGMERSVQFTLTWQKSLSKLCLGVNYPLVKKKKIIMLRSLLAGKELDANQYCRCGSVKCDSTCLVKFLFTYVCWRKSLASRLIKNNYIYMGWLLYHLWNLCIALTENETILYGCLIGWNSAALVLLFTWETWNVFLWGFCNTVFG